MTRNPRDARPLYQQVADQLVTGIQEGQWAPGDKLPSERALCDEFEVSQITVRRALRELRHSGHVHSRHGLGWFVDETAEAPARPEIALVLDGDDRLSQVLLPGCVQALGQHDIWAEALLVGEHHRGAGEIGAMLQSLESLAILWFIAGDEEQAEARYRDLNETAGAPGLFLVRGLQNAACPAIVLDEQRAAGAVTEHLIDLGHERIAYIGADPVGVEGWRRYSGFAQSMWDRGLELPLDWVFSVSRENPLERQRLERIMVPSDRPTAMVCSSDTLAIEVLYRLSRMGLRCPDDVAIVGIGDETFSAHTSVPLTTFAFDLKRWYETVALATGTLLEGGMPESSHLTGDLIVRASCGAS